MLGRLIAFTFGEALAAWSSQRPLGSQGSCQSDMIAGVKYQLKEKVWSLSDTYRILGDTGLEVLSVEGKFFSWG